MPRGGGGGGGGQALGNDFLTGGRLTSKSEEKKDPFHIKLGGS